ncbi:MAG: D-alanine--D-alanine ligase [Myxococcota bacterium]|nr:D-alanine--D-alanine ligase [Myxococcota bacterium]
MSAAQSEGRREASLGNILVLAGGVSAEHEVSLATGEAVTRALLERGHQASLLIIEQDPRSAGTGLVRRLLEQRPDVVFVGLHGVGGEDGRVQGLLEWLRIPYTGSGVEASAVAMNKDLSRQIFAQLSVPHPRGFLWRGPEDLDQREAFLATTHSGSWALKPPSEGSSVGVRKLNTIDDLREALDQSKDQLLVEEWIEGIEVSVPVFQDEAWAPVEIEAAAEAGWYNYEAKYQRGDTRYHLPARLPLAQREQLRQFALKVHTGLSCRGVSRSDFIVSGDACYALEINTLPGMTGSSLVPKAAAAMGIDFPFLIERLVRDASLSR